MNAMTTLNADEDRCVPYATSSLFTGSRSHPIYADRLQPAEIRCPVPVIMIHGGCNTGTCYLRTPDNRPGWAHDFARAGIETYVIDWPGHGRSPMRADFLTLSSDDVSTSIVQMLEETGPAILLGHSAGGPLIWSVSERCPDLVAGLIGVAPGPPANLVPPLTVGSDGALVDDGVSSTGHPILAPDDRLFLVDEDFVREYWFSGPAAPQDAASLFFRSVVPESPRIINERFNVEGKGLKVSHPEIVAARPTLIVGPECDPRHPRATDEETAALFNAEFVWLPDRGIMGNGHMMMGDSNSAAIADLMIRWILDRMAGHVPNIHPASR